MFQDNRETIDSLKETIQNLESQLAALYEEKESRNWGTSAGAAHSETIKNLEAQLASLLAERKDSPADLASAAETIQNLEEQVNSLTNEKKELEAKWSSMEAELTSMRAKAREVGAALLESALFPKS